MNYMYIDRERNIEKNQLIINLRLKGSITNFILG